MHAVCSHGQGHASSCDSHHRPLLVRLRNFVGDVVLGLPALELLRAHGYALTLVGKPWAASLLAGHGWAVHARPSTLLERVRQLRRLRDGAVAQDPNFLRRENGYVMPQSFGSALEMRLAGLRAVGYRWEARGWLFARSFAMPLDRHELTVYFELACRFLRIEAAPPPSIGLKVADTHQQQADRLLSRHGLLGRPFVVIVPFSSGGAQHRGKHWPHFAVYARKLLGCGMPVVACPGPGDATSLLEEDFPAGLHRFHGLELGTYAGVLRRAALVAANDTGPGHVAAAVGAPVLSLFGSAGQPHRWAPWGPAVRTLKSHEGWPGLHSVLEQTWDMLGESAIAQRPPQA